MSRYECNLVQAAIASYDESLGQHEVASQFGEINGEPLKLCPHPYIIITTALLN